jgi:uncharacterized membrane protein YfcA
VASWGGGDVWQSGKKPQIEDATTMDLMRQTFLAGSAAAAGAINAVAGGGTLLSFPAAIAAGLPPVVANATNSIALSPGALAAAWAYRHDFVDERGGDRRRLAALLAVPAVVGGALGALLLHVTSEAVFSAVVPWLVLGATMVMLVQQVGLRLGRGAAPNAAPPPAPRLALVMFLQLLVGIYGGYFGAAMGIVMLAFLSLLGGMEIHQMNAIKNVLGALVNGVASIYFVAAGMVDARAGVLMAVGAVLGGFLGARIARRVPARVVRWAVVAIGLGLSALLAYRRYA